MSQVFARLVMQRGPQPNQTFDLVEEKIGIGRSPNNTIPIPDPEISRKHAQLVWQGEGYALEDLGSTNGSFVNARRIMGFTPLHHGDVIELGEAISLLYLVEAAEAATVLDESEMDTGRWQAPAERFPLEPAYSPPPAQASPLPPLYEPVHVPPQAEPIADAPRGFSCQQQILLGCGLVVLMLFCCMATLYFLDAYDQGRLLYCGPLRSFWQFILGPFGFAPICP